MSILPFRFQSPTLSATKFTSPAPGRFGRLPKHQALVFNGSLGLHALHGSSFWGLVDVQVDFDTERGSLVFSKDPQGKISSFEILIKSIWISLLTCLKRCTVIGNAGTAACDWRIQLYEKARQEYCTVNGRSLALTICRMVETCKHSGTFWTLHDQWEKEYT